MWGFRVKSVGQELTPHSTGVLFPPQEDLSFSGKVFS